MARYDGSFIVGLATLICLVIFGTIGNKRIPTALLSLADCFFGIYLLYPVIMNVLYKVVKIPFVSKVDLYSEIVTVQKSGQKSHFQQ